MSKNNRKAGFIKILGGVFMVMLLATSAHAAAVTISITGITNHTGSAIPTNAYVQVIQSADANKGAPDPSTGLPAGDTVVATSKITPDGTFSGGASITASNYIYIRVWETWNGSGSPSGYYGDSAPQNVGTGFVYTYTPAGFSTNQQINTAPNAPTALTQVGVANGAYVNTNFNITMSMTDPNNPDTLTPQVELTTGSFTGTPNANGSGVAYAGSAVIGTVIVNVASLADGAYKWQARVSDAAAATSSFVQYNGGATSFRVDKTGPSAVTITPPATPTNNTSLAFTWTAASDSGSGMGTTPYYYLLDSNSTATAATVRNTGTGTTNLNATPTGSSGNNYLHVVAVDALGNLSTVANSTVVVVDTTAPQVSSTNPANSATGVSKNLTSITVTFNEAMDVPSVQTTGNYTVTGATSGAHSVSNAVYNAGTVTLTISGTFTDSETVNCSVGTGVKDAVGNNLASAYNWSFQIVNPGAPSITVAPLTIQFSANQGSNPSPNASVVTISNTAGAALTSWTAGTINYSGGQTGWLTPSKSSGGPINVGASDTFNVTVGNVTSFAVGTYTATVPLTFSQGVAAQNVVVTLTIGQVPPNGPSISGILPSTAYAGQTIVVSGSRFGATKGTSTVIVGGVSTYPTSWSDGSITLAVPTGVATGAASVVVTVSSLTDTSSITVNNSSVVLEDYEGGSVGSFTDPATTSGYYSFDDGVAPDNANINSQLKTAAAKYEGGYGAQVTYSYPSTSTKYGGGWGAAAANTLDISSMNVIKLWVKGDGSANTPQLKLRAKTAGGTEVALVSPTISMVDNTYHQVNLYLNSFITQNATGDVISATVDPDNLKRIIGYNLVFTTKNTSSTPIYIDSITAASTSEVPTGESPAILSISPAASPAGTKIVVTGLRFGSAQGRSLLNFNNLTTNVSYQAVITKWSDTTIEAIVPTLAPKGNYEIKVVKIPSGSGPVTALESNPSLFTVTSNSTGADVAIIYPNPFNAGNEVVNISTTNTGGVTNFGFYIFDMTAQLVYKEVKPSGGTTWTGIDQYSKLVGDGAYLVRIINEDTKTMLAKGKILVIKR